jgi:glycosyltransferase involved in cell wall biosynthesis
VRVLIWHGWLLEGSGSNVYTARVAEVLRRQGHDVALVCQEGHPERYGWIDAWGTLDQRGPSALTAQGAASARGRCVLLRPQIGSLLPVFVVDRYEGFDVVKPFVELTDQELDRYLDANVAAVRAAAAWHGTQTAIAGHAIPGGAIARRALGANAYVVKVHGSDLEYAIRPQRRYRDLAREGLADARAVAGASGDVLDRCRELVPGIGDRMTVVHPGVDVEAFRPMPRREALLDAADRLERDDEIRSGRPASLDDEVRRALSAHDADALDTLAGRYDQAVADPDTPGRLRELSGRSGPIVGYLGKLIPQKGVELLLSAATRSPHRPAVLVVGFGSYREWMAALAIALRDRDEKAIAWLRAAGAMPIDPRPLPTAGAVVFTGRLDHRYAPGAIAAMDVLVVPSILEEAFGMVVAEGAAGGALPLVSRHSGLAEVADALETEVGRPGLFSFEPGAGADGRLAEGLDRLLTLSEPDREDLRRTVAAFVARTWSWERTASALLRWAS